MGHSEISGDHKLFETEDGSQKSRPTSTWTRICSIMPDYRFHSVLKPGSEDNRRLRVPQHIVPNQDSHVCSVFSDEIRHSPYVFCEQSLFGPIVPLKDFRTPRTKTQLPHLKENYPKAISHWNSHPFRTFAVMENVRKWFYRCGKVVA